MRTDAAQWRWKLRGVRVDFCPWCGTRLPSERQMDLLEETPDVACLAPAPNVVSLEAFAQRRKGVGA